MPECRCDPADRPPGWTEMAFLSSEKYLVRPCDDEGWHVLHYDEQAEPLDGSVR